jgi:hypothetical protein
MNSHGHDTPEERVERLVEEVEVLRGELREARELAERAAGEAEIHRQNALLFRQLSLYQMAEAESRSPEPPHAGG